MLLEGRRSLRFTKLEKRSPTMAKVATRVPTFHLRPISAAQMEVANTDTTSRGWFSRARKWVAHRQRERPIERAAKRNAEDLLSDDSCPVGHDQQDQQLQQQRAMHKRPHSDHLKPKFIGRELTCGYGGCLLGNLSAVDAVDGSIHRHIGAMDVGAVNAPTIRRSQSCKRSQPSVST